MPDLKESDPIQQARQALMRCMNDEGIEPLHALTAMVQIAAKVSFDSAIQENLSPEDGRGKWMGGCMLAYDAVAGGTIFSDFARKDRKLLKIMNGGKGATGCSKALQHRKVSKLARASRKQSKK